MMTIILIYKYKYKINNNNMYSIIFEKLRENPTIIETFFLMINKTNKFEFYHLQIITNPFYPNSIKQNLIDLFCLIQKYYYAFKKLELLYYYKKKVSKASMDYDFGDTLLTTYSNDIKIHIIENNTSYEFYIPDLIKIICKSLLYHDKLFAAPLLPKNPHTNIPFSKHNLYLIYLKIKNSNYNSSKLFYLFYKCDFDIKVFQIEHENLLRDIHLKNYYKDKNIDEKYHIIISMLETHKRCVQNLIIHSQFPKNKVINAFTPILYDYGVSEYSYNPTKKLYSRNKVRKFLRCFIKNNPKFGRVFYKDGIMINW